MSHDEQNAQPGAPQAGPQSLRKLKSLLLRWWQKHSDEAGAERQSFLCAALIYGGANYLTMSVKQCGEDKSPPDFEAAVSLILSLWPAALKGEAASQLAAVIERAGSLLANQLVRQDFLTLASKAPVRELFLSPLCPSSIYEAFSFNERCLSKDLLQQEKSLLRSSHLISFTQVYTPDWVVDHLLQNTLVKKLGEQNLIECAEPVTLLDPALGGGIFLVRALKHFVAAYRAAGLTTGDAVQKAASKNLFAIDIDPFSIATAALSIMLKAFNLGLEESQVRALLPLVNLVLIESEEGESDSLPMGSLARDLRLLEDHLLARHYDVIVANPPYLGRKLLPRRLKEKLKKQYPDSAHDLSQAFLSMALDLAKPGGRVGFITQGSFLHLPSGRTLRERILTDHRLEQVVELGPGVFPLLAGEKASAALIVIQKSKPEEGQAGHFLSLKLEEDKHGRLALLQQSLAEHNENGNRNGNGNGNDSGQSGTLRRQADFLENEDAAISYQRPKAVGKLRTLWPKLADLAELKQGLATTDNARFLRFVWELSRRDLGGRYVPYARGEGTERWWSPSTTMVLWENNGRAIKEAVNQAYPYLKGKYAWVVKNEDYYFKEGLTFSFVSKDTLAVRRLAPGSIFDVGSSAIFARESGQGAALLAYLNSSLATALAHDLNPTINFQIGDLKKLSLPIFTKAQEEKLGSLASSCVKAKQMMFALASAQNFFIKTNMTGEADQLPASRPPTAGGVCRHSYEQARSTYERYGDELVRGQEEIDRLVLDALDADTKFNGKEKAELAGFASSQKEKPTARLSEEKYCRKNFVEALLAYFYSRHWLTEQPAAMLPAALVASLKSEDDALNILPLLGQFDPAFLREHMTGGKPLCQYLRDHLTLIIEEEFLGQPPLLVLKIAPETILILPAVNGADGELRLSGDPDREAMHCAQAWLRQARDLAAAGLRPKEMLRQLARAELPSAASLPAKSRKA